MTRKSKISAEMLAAYADGELDALSAKRVERAIAADPELAEQLEQRRALKAKLKTHFGNGVQDAAPDRLRPPADVVDLGAARQAREARETRAAKKTAPVADHSVWRRTMGVAGAALVMGVVLGVTSRPSAPGDFITRGGVVVASGAVAHALNGTVSSNEGPIRLSFRDGSGSYCRVFDTGGQSGVACWQGGAWQVRELRAAGPEARTDVRQATSAAVMADARAMMVGDPLDAVTEKTALAKGWR